MDNKLLKSKRVLKGFTQTEIAKLLNMSPKTYNRKELGMVDFTISDLKKIRNLLSLSMSDVEKIFF